MRSDARSWKKPTVANHSCVVISLINMFKLLKIRRYVLNGVDLHYRLGSLH